MCCQGGADGAEDHKGGAKDHHSRADGNKDPHGRADDHHSRADGTKIPIVKPKEQRTTSVDLMVLGQPRQIRQTGTERTERLPMASVAVTGQAEGAQTASLATDGQAKSSKPG